MLSVIIVKGRFVRDPELRRTGSGTAVASFTLACDRDFKNSDGTRDTDFIDCVAWKNTAEYVSKYFSKGSMAVVKGRLQIRTWTDKEGNKHKAAEIIADTVEFADSKNASGKNEFAAPPNEFAAPSDDNFAEMTEDDGQLPF